MKKFALVLFVVGIVFNIVETGYFGWHWHSSCHAESICDTIAGAMMLTAFVLVIGEAIKKIDEIYKFYKMFEKAIIEKDKNK